MNDKKDTNGILLSDAERLTKIGSFVRKTSLDEIPQLLNALLQAGAMGLPSVVTNINGCNEIVQDDFNGLLIPAKDSNAVYEAMKEMVADKELYQKLKGNSRKRIVENYAQKVVWEAILEEYKKL